MSSRNPEIVPQPRLETVDQDPGAAPYALDYRLVQSALNGKESALVRMARHHLSRVPAVVRLLVRRSAGHVSDNDIPDLVQDCLMVIWRRLPSYRGEASLSTWMFRVCQYELLNGMRRLEKHRVRWKSLLELDSGEIPEKAELAQAQIIALDIEDALSQLDPQEAQSIRLKHHEGKTMEVLASSLGVTYSQARTLYCRAIKNLHRLVTERDGGEDET